MWSSLIECLYTHCHDPGFAQTRSKHNPYYRQEPFHTSSIVCDEGVIRNVIGTCADRDMYAHLASLGMWMDLDWTVFWNFLYTWNVSEWQLECFWNPLGTCSLIDSKCIWNEVWIAFGMLWEFWFHHWWDEPLAWPVWNVLEHDPIKLPWTFQNIYNCNSVGIQSILVPSIQSMFQIFASRQVCCHHSPSLFIM